jgi:hypothetical protein
MAWTLPKTWVVGEKPTASLLNTYLRDNVKHIRGDPSTWNTLTLLGSWQVYATSGIWSTTPAYRVKNGICYLRGLVQNLTPGTSNICQLPAAASPAASYYVPTILDSSVQGAIYVDSSGYVQLGPTPSQRGHVSLWPLYFHVKDG